VAVLETAQAGPGLLVLHARLADALRAQGLSVEARPFRPHVTLARTRRELAAPDRVGAWRWPVRGYVLAESRPGRPYRLVARYPLGAGTPAQDRAG
jgi:2'-5' RNA ligase